MLEKNRYKALIINHKIDKLAYFEAKKQHKLSMILVKHISLNLIHLPFLRYISYWLVSYCLIFKLHLTKVIKIIVEKYEKQRILIINTIKKIFP